MIFLLIAITFSASLYVVFKFTEKNRSSRYTICFFNNLSAVVVSYLFISGQVVYDPKWFTSFFSEFSRVMTQGGQFSQSASPALAVFIGLFNGFFYFSAFYVLQLSTAKNGSAMTVTFNKIGVIIPTVLSVIFFGEMPKPLQLIGAIIAMLAIVIIYFKKEENSVITLKIALFGTFFLSGICDFATKVYQVYGSENFQALFVFFTYMFSLITTGIALLIKKGIKRSDVIIGLIIGVPTQFIVRFLLKALMTIPAFIVFPIFSVGVILTVNVINLVFFKEKLSPRQFAAIGMIFFAVVLLKI